MNFEKIIKKDILYNLEAGCILVSNSILVIGSIIFLNNPDFILPVHILILLVIFSNLGLILILIDSVYRHKKMDFTAKKLNQLFEENNSLRKKLIVWNEVVKQIMKRNK